MADGREPRTGTGAGSGVGEARPARRSRVRVLTWGAAGVAVCAVVCLVIWIGAAVGYFTGKPKVTRDYTEAYRARVAAIPEAERAEPVYLAAMAKGVAIKSELYDRGPGAPGWPHISPDDPRWEAALEYNRANAEMLEGIRRAAAMEKLAAKLRGSSVEEQARAWTPAYGPTPAPAGGTLEDGVPYLLLANDQSLRWGGPMRAALRELVFDSRVAAEEGDAERVLANLMAMNGLVRHLREFNTFIADMTATACYGVMLEEVRRTIAGSPGLLGEGQLAVLGTVLAAYGDGGPPTRLESAEYEFEDMVQRGYTDNGRGGGRITRDGAHVMYGEHAFAADTGYETVDFVLHTLVEPVIAMISVDRAELLRKHRSMMEAARAWREIPAWERPEHPLTEEISRLEASWAGPYRYPMLLWSTPVVIGVSQSDLVLEMMRKGALAGIALEVHRLRYGVYPERLAELVERGLLERVPVDLYDGNEVRYALVEGSPVVYSVGGNREDDGGAVVLGQFGVTAGRKWLSAGEMARLRAEGRAAEIPGGDLVLWHLEKRP